MNPDAILEADQLIADAIALLGPRIAGIKDSSGDLPYCRTVAKLSPALAVFPATEAALLEAREGLLAGCISASANLNADLCARAYHHGDAAAADAAIAIRGLVAGPAIVSAVKGALSALRNDPEIARVRPPLRPLDAEQSRRLGRDMAEIRSGTSMSGSAA